MMAQEQINLQKILRDKFKSIQSRNPNFSVRAYAKRIGVAPGTLSLVMLGKRKASEELTRKFAESLMFDPQEYSEVFKKPKLTEEEKLQLDEYIQLSVDQYNLMSEWHYLAMLSLLNIEKFNFTVKNVAKKLNIKQSLVESSIDLLMRLELIKIDANGKYYREKPKYRTPDDVSNTAIRKSHHETLNLAQEKLQTVDVQDRDYSCITFAFDPQKMKQAKALIRKFEDEFLAHLNKDADFKEVYRMSIQLFPLTDINTKDHHELN